MDVVDLRRFYTSALGHVVHHLLETHIAQIWPDIRGLSVMGLGYTLPYLNGMRDQAERVLAFSPARQGIIPWPNGQLSCSALIEPADLPLPDLSIDRILMIHMLETSDSPHDVLTDIWRVMAPGGRLLMIAPNRKGLWARFDSTPFGEGRPFSQGQLLALLRDCLFTPESWREALFMPPFERRIILKSAKGWEKLGSVVPLFGGVHVIEATKQLYRPITVRPAQRLSFRWKPLLSPVPLPAPGS